MAWPLLVAAGIGAAGSIASSLIGSGGSDRAANIAERERKDIWRTTKPYRIAGENALAQYLDMLKAGPGEFRPEDQPGYMYGYQRTVEDPLTRQAAVRGRLYDPSTQMALGRRAQDYASTQYDNFLSRYYQKMQPYANMATQGLQASSRSAVSSSTLVPTQTNAAYQGANAMMAGIGGLSNIANSALQYYQTANQLNQLQPQSASMGGEWGKFN
jgi:hypothetical protein